MNSDVNRIKAVFLAAVEQPSSDQRGAYLDEVCAGDPALRHQVELLLGAHAGTDGLFDHTDPAALVTIDERGGVERSGTAIGPYHLLEPIGEGGFGIVFLAEQTQPVRRKVALKVLKPGMDTRQVVARFEAERQALALMDHPNIAHVLDGGATASGRPYFVMELVRGVPITDFCDQARLSIRMRLELFVSVCQAVQHAHQKGVIHRDLKPSNVMVALHEDRDRAEATNKAVEVLYAAQQRAPNDFTLNFRRLLRRRPPTGRARHRSHRITGSPPTPRARRPARVAT
jgi:serine/threonine protein kinase